MDGPSHLRTKIPPSVRLGRADLFFHQTEDAVGRRTTSNSVLTSKCKEPEGAQAGALLGNLFHAERCLICWGFKVNHSELLISPVTLKTWRILEQMSPLSWRITARRKATSRPAAPDWLVPTLLKVECSQWHQHHPDLGLDLPHDQCGALELKIITTLLPFSSPKWNNEKVMLLLASVVFLQHNDEELCCLPW